MGKGINKRGNQKENKRKQIEKAEQRKKQKERWKMKKTSKSKKKREEILKQEQQWIKKYDKKRIFGIDVVFHYEHLAC